MPSENPQAMATPRRWLAVKRLTAIAGSVVLLAGAYWSLRLGYADLVFARGTDEAAETAALLAPGSARYLEAAATGRAGLERALEALPVSSNLLIKLGLLCETEGDLQAAEQYLLRAASADRGYLPRWTLANFYFRQSRMDEFWKWGRLAAGTAYSDQSALFDLYWRTRAKPEEILERGIPGGPQILAQYLNYLLLREKIPEAEPVGDRLLAAATRDSLPLLASYCNHLLRAGRFHSALVVWNRLCSRGILPYHPLDPSRGAIITNGDFRQRPLAAGFDWRIQQVEGAGIGPSGPSGPLRVALSGKQPEHCLLLEQILPVAQGSSYRINFRMRSAGPSDTAGLIWRVWDFTGARLLAEQSLETEKKEDRGQDLVFTAPAGAQAVRLRLEYHRPLGLPRTECTIYLSAVQAAVQNPGGR